MLQLETVAMKESRTKESAIMNQLQADVNELKKKNHELTMTVQRIEQDVTSAKSTITAIRRENSEALKNIDCQHCDLNTSKLKKLEHDVTKINTHILNIFPKKQRSVSNPEQNTSAKDGKYSVTVDKTVSDNQTKHCDTEPTKQNTIKVPAAPEISHKKYASNISGGEDKQCGSAGTSDHVSYSDVARSAPVPMHNKFAPLANCRNLLYDGRNFKRPSSSYEQDNNTNANEDIQILHTELGADLAPSKQTLRADANGQNAASRQTPTRSKSIERSFTGNDEIPPDNRAKTAGSHNAQGTNTRVQVGNEIFVGVRREPVIRYHLGNIDRKSTRSGILMHFEQQKVNVTQLSLFRTQYGNLYARINIPSVFCDQVESDDFPLPEGVILSKWQSRPRRQTRRRQAAAQQRRDRGRESFYDNEDINEYENPYNRHQDRREYSDSDRYKSAEVAKFDSNPYRNSDRYRGGIDNSEYDYGNKWSRDDRDHGYTTQNKSYRKYGAYDYADNRYSKENYTERWNSEVDSRYPDIDS